MPAAIRRDRSSSASDGPCLAIALKKPGRPRLVELHRGDGRDVGVRRNVALQRAQARILGAGVRHGRRRLGARRRLGRRPELDGDQQRPVHAGAEVLGEQVVGTPRGRRGRERRRVLLAEIEGEERDRQRDQDRERGETAEQRPARDLVRPSAPTAPSAPARARAAGALAALRCGARAPRAARAAA